jgi:hypothetical protein
MTEMQCMSRGLQRINLLLYCCTDTVPVEQLWLLCFAVVTTTPPGALSVLAAHAPELFDASQVVKAPRMHLYKCPQDFSH